MKLVLQKASMGSVNINGEVVGQIGQGYVIFLGIIEGDTEDMAETLAKKVVNLRLFEGEDGKINDVSLLDIGGAALVVSQFTLAGETKKGNRPDYTKAAKPQFAEKLYDAFVDQLRLLGVTNVQTGVFGAMMNVELVNEGPVTLILDA